MLKQTNRLGLILLITLCCLCAKTAAIANIRVDFEKGSRRDGTAVAGLYQGLRFSNLSYGTVRFADITTGFYNVTSDIGSTYGQGEYFISGRCAAYVQDAHYIVRVDITTGPASSFKVGYSSDSAFTVRAYDANNSLITSTTGAANTRSLAGSGLAYLTVVSSTSNIAYVSMLTTAPTNGDAFWLIDNIEVIQ